MAPGFTASGFEAGTAAALLPCYPARAADIERYAVRGSDHVMPPGTI
jgi:hypothetical protein